MTYKWMNDYDKEDGTCNLVYVPWDGIKIFNIDEYPSTHPYGRVDFVIGRLVMGDLFQGYEAILHSTHKANIPPMVYDLKEAMEKVESFIRQYYEWEKKTESLNQF